MIKFITDSASDIPSNEVAENNITIMNIPITIDGTTYYEGKDFTSEEYYAMLANAKEIPTHAQITMMQFEEAFYNAIKEGCKHIICVTITSTASGINDAAQSAKKILLEEKPEEMEGVTIDIYDSQTYTYCYGHVVVQAAKIAKHTQDIEKVRNYITKTLSNQYVVVGLTNLTYAKKSGRITSAAAFVGDMMGFRPLLHMQDGTLVTFDKVRGDSKLISRMADDFFAHSSENGDPYYIICSDNMDCAKLLYEKVKHSKNVFGGYYRVGASVTTNAGPTLFGITTHTPIN